jgi:ABC-type branched-subunit amino acid transport system permease subunit
MLNSLGVVRFLNVSEGWGLSIGGGSWDLLARACGKFDFAGDMLVSGGRYCYLLLARDVQQGHETPVWLPEILAVSGTTAVLLHARVHGSDLF